MTATSSVSVTVTPTDHVDHNQQEKLAASVVAGIVAALVLLVAAIFCVVVIIACLMQKMRRSRKSGSTHALIQHNGYQQGRHLHVQIGKFELCIIHH